MTGIEPTGAVTEDIEVSPALGVLTFTGIAPTVVATGGTIEVNPSLGVLTFTGIEPVVFATDPKNVSPSLGVLTFTGIAPTAVSDTNIAIGLGEIVFTGYAPLGGDEKFGIPTVNLTEIKTIAVINNVLASTIITEAKTTVIITE